jgi:hypothetical protein
MGKENGRFVMILDRHRGVYGGHLKKILENGNAVKLERARHCYSFDGDGDKGVYGLATTGPGPACRVGPEVDMVVRNVAKVVEVSRKACAKWKNADW